MNDLRKDIPPWPLRRRVSRGFTLVELLIVVMLICILAVLLSSSFGALRKSAENTRCVSNLKGLGAAILSYSADFNGMILPRCLGLYRPVASKPAPEEMLWPCRLVGLGYVENLDVFYCPSFFPKSSSLARYKIKSDTGKFATSGADTYGMRIWVPPGGPAWKADPLREEHKRLNVIETPADFFILTDSVWTHSAYKSQGYGISPGLENEQFVHLRHKQRANALFADGHVAAKDEDYFKALSNPDRQNKYSSGESLKFGTTTEMEFR